MDKKEFAKHLRTNQTDAEKLFWSRVRNRRLLNLKFKRQYVIEPYIVDFVCIERKLIVELDGGQHAERQDYDKKRSQYLENLGFTVLRFWDHDVLLSVDSVLDSIYNYLNSHPGL